jgi:RNA recognition motif-containing protein
MLPSPNEGSAEKKVDSDLDGVPDPEPGANLFIMNVPFHFTEKDIYRRFRPYGPICNIGLPRDEQSRSRGRVFLHFLDISSANQVLSEAGSIKMANMTLRISRATNTGKAYVRSPAIIDKKYSDPADDVKVVSSKSGAEKENANYSPKKEISPPPAGVPSATNADTVPIGDAAAMGIIDLSRKFDYPVYVSQGLSTDVMIQSTNVSFEGDANRDIPSFSRRDKIATHMIDDV